MPEPARQQRTVYQYVIEIATTTAGDAVETLVRHYAHSLSSSLGDSQRQVRVMRSARRVIFDDRPMHPIQRPDDPHL